MTGCPGEMTSPGSATSRLTTPSTGATSVVLASLASISASGRLGIDDLRLRDSALLSGRTSHVFCVSGFELAVIGFGLVEGRGSLVKLLLAREVLCRERRRSRVVDLRKGEIGFGDTKILRRRVDFFFADARVDIGPIGRRRGEVGLGLFNGGGKLGTAQHGKNVSLAHLLSGAHPIGRHAAVYFRGDADFGFVHDPEDRRRRRRSPPSQR